MVFFMVGLISSNVVGTTPIIVSKSAVVEFQGILHLAPEITLYSQNAYLPLFR